jgi:YidC/Oxa1 family membrane protein insertase
MTNDFFLNGSVTSEKTLTSPKYLRHYTSELGVPFNPSSSNAISMKLFYGPNHINTLKKEGMELDKLVFLGRNIIGWINRFAIIPIFNWLERYFESYGLIILILTILIKVVLFPLTFKSYQSTAKMQEVQPLIQEIQRKYKNDKDKLNQEMMKVYQENKVNPAGGCLPLVVQMPIIISLYWVVTQPLKFMLNIPVDKIYGKFNESKVLIENGLMQIFNIKQRYNAEIFIVNNFNPDKVKDLLNQDLINRIVDIGKGLNFLGLNLSFIPTIDTNKLFGAEAAIYLPLLLIPILGVLTTYISTKLTMPQTPQGAEANPTQNAMMYMGPVMTLIFSFQLPAGVGLYWIAGYVFQIFQQLYINKHIMKKKEAATK